MPVDDEFPAHVIKLIENLEEIGLLTGLHTAMTGSGPGRRHGVEVLNKSALVLLVASWEAYVEDLAESAFSFMLEHAETPSVFPNGVLAKAAKPLKEADNPKDLWLLAGDGWKEVLKDHQSAIVKSHIGKLNTPKPQQIDSLIDSLIGLKGLSSSWKWHGISNGNAKAQLEELVERRGEVAHRVKASTYVAKKYVNQMRVFLQRLACISSNRVRGHILRHTKEEPWIGVTYRKTS